jgi:hypothetical protein
LIRLPEWSKQNYPFLYFNTKYMRAKPTDRCAQLKELNKYLILEEIHATK